MKNIIGFAVESEEEISAREAAVSEEVPEGEKAVRSVVSVRFDSGNMALNYYNDLFDIHVGDKVFVSGKYYGEVGTVEKVTTSFRINLKNYERVIARPVVEFHGEYKNYVDKMVSLNDSAPSPEVFRSWVMPPVLEEEEAEIVSGEGYSLSLHEMESSPLIEEKIIKRAMEYCEQGNVLYLSLRDGKGTAFVRGTTVYEIDFSFNGETVSDLFCSCPYPYLCKHIVAVLVQLRALWHMTGEPENFVAIDEKYFWNAVRNSGKITL